MATFWLRASPKRASGPRAPKQLPCCPKLPASSSQVRPSPGIKSPATEPSYPSVVNKTMSYCRSVASVGASQIDFLAAGLDASSIYPSVYRTRTCSAINGIIDDSVRPRRAPAGVNRTGLGGACGGGRQSRQGIATISATGGLDGCRLGPWACPASIHVALLE